VVVELMDAGPLEDLSAAAELLEPLLDGIATDLWETQDIRCETFEALYALHNMTLYTVLT